MAAPVTQLLGSSVQAAHEVASEGLCGSLLTKEPGVDEAGWDAPQEGRSPEDPVVVPNARHERWPEGACRVDAHAADGPLQPHQQRHNQADRQRAEPAPAPADTSSSLRGMPHHRMVMAVASDRL